MMALNSSASILVRRKGRKLEFLLYFLESFFRFLLGFRPFSELFV